MEVKNQPKLSFHGVDFPKVFFDCKDFYDKKNQIDLNIDPKVIYKEGNNKMFRILMDVNLSCKDFFKLSLIAIGTFELTENLNDDLKKQFINANAPAIMFPYVRSFISTLTGNLGNITGALNIPTQFFNGTLKELKPDTSKEIE